MNKIGTLKDENILFLQGPMGSFFQKIDLLFREKGANTFKIGFNAGDMFFSNQDNYIPYKDKKENWEMFIYTFLKNNKIDKIFLFGDCRFYQRITIQVSDALNVEVFVFEEGYIRPDFITMEKHGVNDFSHIPREAKFYYDAYDSHEEIKIFDAESKYYRRAWAATIYFIMKDIFWFRYPYYTHHTSYNFLQEFFFGIRNIFRKYTYTLREKHIQKLLLNRDKNNYYFVPLQTYNDFQISEHSHFRSIEEFIKEVIYSFAKCAPTDTKLVIKHHPMDRGRKNYSTYIQILSKKFGIKNRVIVIHDLHLPSCLKYAKGTIIINSTVGLSSLYHQTPTIVLGNAIYDIEGLTCKDMILDDFWIHYYKPNKALFNAFKQYLIKNTQLNGAFYGRFPNELR